MAKGEIYRIDIANRLKLLEDQGGMVAKKPVQFDSNPDEHVYKARIQEIRLAYLNVLRKALKPTQSKILIKMADTWTDIRNDMPAAEMLSKNVDRWYLSNIIHGKQYFAFWICNLDNSKQSFNVKLAKPARLSQVNYYEARFVLSRSFANVPDAMVPLLGDIEMAPGEMKLVIMTCKALKSGLEQQVVTVSGKSGRDSVFLNIHNYPMDISVSSQTLNAITWPYFFYPMLIGKEEEAIANLKEHYINTVDIPLQKLPSFVKPVSTSEFEAYVKLCANFRHIIVQLDILRQSRQADFFSATWKSKFLSWYLVILKTMVKYGVGKERLYLYLADEPTGKDVPVLIEFCKWIRKALPYAKLYASLNSEETIKGLLPWLDIAQLYNRHLMDVQVKTDNTKKVWLYDTKNRSLSPYISFRLMAWEAFFRRCGGIGFWNFAQAAEDNGKWSEWDDFDGNFADYNVVYTYKGQLLNSRRWEAFRLGIEDYHLLVQAEKKLGAAIVRKYCATVLQRPDNSRLADDIRNAILRQLYP